MDLVNGLELDSNQYRRLMMKILNEDKDEVALKLGNFEDVLKVYLYDASERKYLEVELDMNAKEFIAGNAPLMTYEDFMNGKYQLLQVELQSDQMFKKILEGIKDLSDNHSISYDYNYLSKMVNDFEGKPLLDYPSAQNIKELYSEYQNSEQIVGKIDRVIDDITKYKEKYIDNEDILNLSAINHSFKQNAQVSVYYDSWIEMKSLNEKKMDYLKVVLKNETEQFLKEYQSVFKNIDLDQNNLSIADYISRNNVQDLSTKEIIPLVANGNLNDNNERLRGLLDNYLVSQYVEFSIKRTALSEPSLDFENSELYKLIEKSKDHSLNNIINLSIKEFKDVYGERFVDKTLFPPEDLSNPSELLEKLKPAIIHDTLSIYELHQFEPSNTREMEILKFWEGKSINLLEDSLNLKEQGQGMIRDFKEQYLSSEEMQKLFQRIDELTLKGDELSLKLLNGIKDNLETAKDTMIQIKKEVHKDLMDDKEDRQLSNRNYSNFLFLNKVERNIDSAEVYINFTSNQIVKESQKEMEYEL
jgi:hypothetical protein